MNNESFLILEHSNLIKHCVVLGAINGIDDISDLVDGVDCPNGAVSGIVYDMDSDFPNNLVLTDSLMNVHGLAVVSERLADVIKKQEVPMVKYYSVGIRNHKGKILPDPYYILHPVSPIDCLDVQACGARMSRVDKSMIASVKRLSLITDLIASSRKIFRPSNFPEVTLVRRDLAEILDATGYTGFRWVELSQYPEI